MRQSLNNVSWIPSFPGGVTNCNPACAEYSSTSFFTWASGENFANATESLTVEQARNALSLVQTGTAANGYTTILQFNDAPYSGSAVYEGKITFSNVTAVPLPAGVWLLLSGMTPVLLGARRRPRVYPALEAYEKA